jgi:hypothetical protein
LGVRAERGDDAREVRPQQRGWLALGSMTL